MIFFAKKPGNPVINADDNKNTPFLQYTKKESPTEDSFPYFTEYLDVSFWFLYQIDYR